MSGVSGLTGVITPSTVGVMTPQSATNHRTDEYRTEMTCRRSELPETERVVARQKGRRLLDSERLVAELINRGYIRPGVTYRVERTYAGFWQRREGAYSWMLVDQDGRDQFVGSRFPVRECARGFVYVAGELIPLSAGPWRECASCGGQCRWHMDAWVCDSCGDEWCEGHGDEYVAPMDEHHRETS